MSNVQFDHRHPGPELMDDFYLDNRVLEVTLQEISFINAMLGGNNVTFQALKKLLTKSDQASIVVADLGCGRGDMIQAMQQVVSTLHNNVRFIGIDANKESIRLAKSKWHQSHCLFYCVDVTDQEFNTVHFDWAFCTLFLHHLSDQQIITLLSGLRKRGVKSVVNDLHRHPIAYYLIKWLTMLFSKSYMVKHDAPMSVLRGFSKAELIDLAKASGYEHISIQWKWAFRWQMILER